MLNLSHKKLRAWQVSVEFVSAIYKLTQSFPKSEVYGITSQLRRAAISISSNIAEGAARSSVPERRRFYEISRSSLVEIDTQLEIAKRLKYCSSDELRVLGDQMNHTFALLSRLIKSTV